MKKSATFLLSLFFILTLASFGLAQSARDNSGDSNKSNSTKSNKTTTGGVEVTTKYDRSKNETTIEFEMMEIKGLEPQEVLVSVSSTFSGEKLKKTPEDVIFILSVVSPGSYKYPEAMELKITADGRKLPAVTILNLDKRRVGSSYLETMGTRMRYDVFQKIAQAENVQVQVEDIKFQLTGAQIAKFAELAELLDVN